MLPMRRSPLPSARRGLLVAAMAWAQAADAAPLTSAQPAPTPAQMIAVRATSAMSRCLATWNRSSQMSKREWRDTCRRVVKTNPGLYSKPF